MAEAGPPRLLVETFETAAAGLRRQETLALELAAEGAPLLLAWRSPQALILGRADTRLPAYAAAAVRLPVEGWPLPLRRSGGTACPVGPGTLQLALARPGVAGLTMDAAYAELADLIGRLLAPWRLELEAGEVPLAFCAGRWDLSHAGRKLAGLSQHWARRAGLATVTTAASLIVAEEPALLARTAERFYALAGAPRRCPPEAIGSLHLALGSGGRGELMSGLLEALAAACQRPAPPGGVGRMAARSSM